MLDDRVRRHPASSCIWKAIGGTKELSGSLRARGIVIRCPIKQEEVSMLKMMGTFKRCRNCNGSKLLKPKRFPIASQWSGQSLCCRSCAALTGTRRLSGRRFPIELKVEVLNGRRPFVGLASGKHRWLYVTWARLTMNWPKVLDCSKGSLECSTCYPRRSPKWPLSVALANQTMIPT